MVLWFVLIDNYSCVGMFAYRIIWLELSNSHVPSPLSLRIWRLENRHVNSMTFLFNVNASQLKQNTASFKISFCST